MAKKFLSILLTLVLVLGLLPAAGAAAVSTSPTFSDMPDNWATEALESAVANGLLVGDDGKIMPDSPLTRAQMATIIARAFGATEEGDISVYADVKSTDWFAVSMAKAYKMGVMQGYAGKMDPNSNITREQAFAVLARALKLEISSSINKTFEDEGEISDWAKGEVYALVNAGYIQGSNGRLNPQANISRAEFAQMMHNLIKQYIKAEGEYTQVADGNIMVNVPNVTLKNVTITGDLIVGDGVGDGDLILDNVTIKGRLLARGGGVNSIIIIGGSVEGKVIVAKVDGDIRVSVEGGADVEVIVIDDGKDDVIIEGTVGTVEVSVPDVPVIIQNATISKIDVNCEGAADITIAETGSVTNVVIGGNSEGTALNVEGNVTNIETSAPDTVISGTGAVGTVTANEGADNTSVTTPNTVVNNEGASAVTAGGGKEVPEDSSATNNNQGTDVITTPPSGGEPSYVAVSAISVDPDVMLLTVNDSETITATVQPTNASDKRVTWSSSDETIATVDANGKVTGKKGGTATITVTSAADSSKKATKQVIVGDLLVPAGTSIQDVINDAENGQVIAVAPAEYKEQLTIDKPLTLLGPNADIAGHSEDRVEEAVITYPDDVTDTYGGKKLVYSYSDNVTIKGFSFINEQGWKDTGAATEDDLFFAGENIVFENNRVEMLANKIAVRIAWDWKETNSKRTHDKGAVVKNNYIKGLGADVAALYLQGMAGMIENNVIEANIQGLQVQPYGNDNDGTVIDNQISAYVDGIWHNTQWNNEETGKRGKWTYEGNTFTARKWDDPSGYLDGGTGYRWRAFRVQGTHSNIEIVNNTFDGSNVFDENGEIKEYWSDAIGVICWTGVTNSSFIDIKDNTMINVTIGVQDDAGILSKEALNDILNNKNNTFPAGSISIGNQIKVFVPEEGKVYNKRTGQDYATIQDAVNAANEDDTILVGPGTYTVNIVININKNLTITGEEGVIFKSTGTNSILQPSNRAKLTISDVEFKGTVEGREGQQRGIDMVANTEVVVTGCTFDTLRGGLYANPGAMITVTGSTFTNVLAGIGTDTAAENLNISGNTFVELGEAVGFTAPRDTKANFDALKADIIENNTGATDANVIAYGTYMGDLTEYNALLAAVKKEDYTTASWAAYQAEVTKNTVTGANTQREIDVAIVYIKYAQMDLILATVKNTSQDLYYASIQEAITDLADGETLTILSDELILAEKILFKNNGITIQGQTDADGNPITTIKGAGNEVEQFRIEGYNVTVRDLIFDNIANGRAGGGTVRENVGVYFYYPNGVWQEDRVNKLINCVSNNTYWSIFSGVKMNFEMEGCTFTKTGTLSSVFMDRPFDVTITDCSFSGQDGYALHIDNGVVDGVFDVSNSDFTGGVVTAGDSNNKTGSGNEVYTFTYCDFYTSSGENGGWYASYYSSGSKFENCTFDADFDGAGTGKYSYSGSFVFLDSNCTRVGNPLDTTFFYNVGEGVISGVNVTLNNEGEVTGGIFVNDPTTNLADGYAANESGGTWEVTAPK